MTGRIKSVKNIRTFEGIPAEDGRVIASSAFIRSGALDKLTAKDKAILLGEAGLRTVIDLRTDQERAEKPNVDLEGVETVHIPLLNESVLGITHEGDTDRAARQEDMIPDMPAMYAAIVTNDLAVEGIRRAFEIILEAPEKGAVLWHCTEGKDRSGILSALFLMLLGVGPERVLADYMLTGAAAEKKARRMYMLVLLARRDRRMAEKVRAAYRADERYLRAMIDAVSKQCGSVESFFRDRLGISDEERERFRSSVLADCW